MLKKMGVILFVAVAIIFTGCNEDSENLAKAQKCLDKLDETQSEVNLKADVDSCMDKLKNNKSQQAYIIRCAGGFIRGGITTSRITAAATLLKDDDGDDKEMRYMMSLSFDNDAGAGDDEEVKDAADEAYDNCLKTEVKSLIYLAGLMRAGTYIAVLGGLGIDFDNPPTEGDLDTLIGVCQTTPATCSDPAVVDSIETVAENYCIGGNADSEICKDIDAAMDSGNSGAAISCLLSGGTFTAPNTCTP